METNESILVRSVVGLDDRRVIGKMRELRVDCDTLAVSHYIVASATTTAPLVLPFDRALAVGDTFVTVQSRENFLPASDASAQALIAGGFKLVDVEVYSRTGDKLGVVAGYEFDPVYGAVTGITLDDGTVYAADTFVFFAPEFVFVDNGAKTAAELRAGGEAAAKEEVAEEAAAEEAPTPSAVEMTAAVAVAAVEAEEEAEEEVVEEAAAEAAPELSAEDAQLVELLVGATLVDDVTSEDGAFAVKKETVLTREIVDEAIAHDALLLLTLAADL